MNKTSAKIVGIETDKFKVQVGERFYSPSASGMDYNQSEPGSGLKVKAIHRGSKGGVAERGIFIVVLDNGYVVEIVERGSYLVYWSVA